MKIIVLLSLLAVHISTFGQIENAQHIPGTKCSLIPPKGFVLAKEFSGFQNSDIRASIIIIELPGPFEAYEEDFTVEALKSQGMTLLDIQTVDFNASKATLLKVSQKAQSGSIYLKQILVFGDSSKTILVNGIYPQENKNIEADIKKSLFSISYNSVRSNNPLEAARFSIDVGDSEFKFAKLMTRGLISTLIYTLDGQAPTKSPDNANIMVLESLNAGRPLADKKQYSIAELSTILDVESNVIKEIGPITIDNLKGFKIVAEDKDIKDRKQLIYFVTLFNDDGLFNDDAKYFIFIGLASDKLDFYLNKFKNIAKSFKRQ